MLLLAKSGNNWSAMFGQFFFLILIFIGILFLAYFSTRLLMKSRMAGRGKNIKIIEGLSLGMQGSLQLIKVADKYYLIGVTRDNINFLTQIQSDMIEDDKEEETDFGNILRNVWKRHGKK